MFLCQIHGRESREEERAVGQFQIHTRSKGAYYNQVVVLIYACA